jgi:hypothetical protein
MSRFNPFEEEHSGISRRPYEPLRVYIAASSQELDRVEAVAARLKAGGVSIPLEWWHEVRGRTARGQTDGDLVPAERVRIRHADEWAIANAEIVLGLSGEHSGGRTYELGFAAALASFTGVRTVLSGNCHPIFGHHTTERLWFQDDEAAIVYILSMVDARKEGLALKDAYAAR